MNIFPPALMYLGLALCVRFMSHRLEWELACISQVRFPKNTGIEPRFVVPSIKKTTCKALFFSYAKSDDKKTIRKPFEVRSDD